MYLSDDQIVNIHHYCPLKIPNPKPNWQPLKDLITVKCGQHGAFHSLQQRKKMLPAQVYKWLYLPHTFLMEAVL